MFKRIAARIYRPITRILTVNPSETLKAFRLFTNAAWVLGVYFCFIGVRRPTVVRFRNGARIAIRSYDDLSCLWECWVREEYPLTGRESVIIDAGANIGAFTLYAAYRNPKARIISLEPVKATFANLEENVRLNGLEDRVRTLPVGVSGRSSVLRINASAKSPYSSVYRDIGGHKEDIKVLGMADMLLETGGLDEIDFLKMDCEGSEVDCLMNAGPESLRKFKKIYLEYHSFSGCPLNVLEKKMAQAGFSRSNFIDNRDGTCMIWFDLIRPGSSEIRT